MDSNLRSSSGAVTIRAGTERDYARVARLQQASPEAAQWPLGDYSGTSLLIAYSDAEAVGFCAWRQSTGDEAELLNLAVDPATRRLGVAAAMLAKLEKTATGTLFLEVAEDNIGAIALYERHGWQRIGLRKGYYSQGKTDGIVMKKRSC